MMNGTKYGTEATGVTLASRGRGALIGRYRPYRKEWLRAYQVTMPV